MIAAAADFEAGLAYLATRSSELAETVLGHTLDVDTLCFFTHSPEEYAFVEKMVLARGPKSKFSHGATTYVTVDLIVAGQHIRILGVRQPDPTRPQRGYGDYPVADYAEILKTEASNPHIKEITSGRGKSLIELRHPDFDVLGFIVDQRDHM